METAEVINGYTVTGSWKNGQRGMTVKATRGGKKYFLKKYTKFVLPTIGDGMFDEKTIEAKTDGFNDFKHVRERVIELLAPVAGPGGNIMIPGDHFVNGLHYYEATEFIENVVPDDEIDSFLSSLTYDKTILLMKTAAGALSAVHGRGIIHSDLKLPNIMIVKNSADNFVAKIIDFDSSYPKDKKKYIGGDDVYCSPELLVYSNSEDDEEGEELIAKITEKTDIFSLGVVFHYYLTRKFPEAVKLSDNLQRRKELLESKGRKATFYVNQLLLDGCELKLSDEIKSTNIKCLIYDMLEFEPEKRPTAMQVLMRLKQGEPTIDEATWPEHRITLLKDKLTSSNIVGFKKISVAGVNKYEVIYSTGRRFEYSKDELMSLGYAKTAAPEGFAEPWPEHDIALDLERLKSRAFISSENEVRDGIKGYKLYRSDGQSQFLRLEMLIALKYANKKSAGSSTPVVEAEEVGFAEPWPEHNIEFDTEAIKAKGYVGMVQKNMSGINGYEFVRSNGTRQFIRVEMVVALRMATKK